MIENWNPREFRTRTEYLPGPDPGDPTTMRENEAIWRDTPVAFMASADERDALYVAGCGDVTAGLHRIIKEWIAAQVAAKRKEIET